MQLALPETVCSSNLAFGEEDTAEAGCCGTAPAAEAAGGQARAHDRHQRRPAVPAAGRREREPDDRRLLLPPHIAAAICGHQLLDTTMGYAAIYPENVINHHRAFIARRRAQRPSEEYRDLRPEEWDEFLGHFELRKVALGVCTRDYGTNVSTNIHVQPK